MTQPDQGASADADRAGGLRPEPAAQSQPKALIPSAEFALRVMRLMADQEWWDGEIWWHPFDDAPDTILVNCNDLFMWACADCERLTPDNLDLLAATADECNAIDDCEGPTWAPLLFCCRVRQMRPQGAYYRSMPPSFHALFDACGPEREATFGNPMTQAQGIEARSVRQDAPKPPREGQGG